MSKYCIKYEDIALYDDLSLPNQFFDNKTDAKKAFKKIISKIKKNIQNDWVIISNENEFLTYPQRQYSHNHIKVTLTKVE
jgi:hypothetical protein